jgi:cell division transport system permease protein
MTHFVRKALADIKSNRFLNLITIITISLSILVVSVFLLFFENASRVIESWNQGGRAMVYLTDEFTLDRLPKIEKELISISQIEKVQFISKTQALEKMKEILSSHSVFLNNLKDNPLPDAMEIQIASTSDFSQIEDLAMQIKKVPYVAEVEYGQGWLGKFLKVFNLFKITGYAMCTLFFFIALFITANTVRLAFYSRRLEVEIMRLVGATETFIKAPFYVEGLIQGFLGGLLGLAILMAAFLTVSSGIAQNLSSYVYFDVQFLSIKTIIIIILGSTFLGWFGCYLSLKQILK